MRSNHTKAAWSTTLFVLLFALSILGSAQQSLAQLVVVGFDAAENPDAGEYFAAPLWDDYHWGAQDDLYGSPDANRVCIYYSNRWYCRFYYGEISPGVPAYLEYAGGTDPSTPVGEMYTYSGTNCPDDPTGWFEFFNPSDPGGAYVMLYEW